jgi:hypothetical protein
VGQASDDAFMSQVERYLARLTASGMPVRSLDAGTIEALASRSGVLADEVDRRRRIRVQLAQAERGIRHMFGDPPEGLTRPPRMRRRRAVLAPPTAPPTRPRPATVHASWSKTLTVSDAMRKTIGNQRAYVILGKAGQDIDQKTYFREEFFRGVSWVSQVMRSGNVKEIADVSFEVIVEQQKLGDFVVRIDHAEKRIADQNNAPTWLHWSSLMDVVRTTDLTGYTLTLELLADATFRLRLTS